jgi:hypothetical protein
VSSRHSAGEPKEAQDNLVRQYNAQLPQSSLRKKGWTPFRTEDEVVLSAPLEYLKDDGISQLLFEQAKTLSQYEVIKELRKAIEYY